MTMAPLSPELRQAFEETHYTVRHQPPFTLRIGQPCPELDALLEMNKVDTAAFITAWNPLAQRCSNEQNTERQERLVAELKHRSLDFIAGIGQHPSNGWEGEDSMLVLGLQPEAARALCVDFEQLACVTYRRGSVAQLLVTSAIARNEQ